MSTASIGKLIKCTCIVAAFMINAIVFWMHAVWIMFGLCLLMIPLTIWLYAFKR